MSSAVISTSAAQGRFFVFDAERAPEMNPLSFENRKPAEVLRTSAACLPQSTINIEKSKILNSVTPASRLAVRPTPEMVSSGITAIDSVTGGLPRGCLTEIFGPVSSGRTTMLLAALAAATWRGECCAIVDASDTLAPQSLAAAGADLNRLLWVRCGKNLPRSHPSTSLRSGSVPEKRIAENCLEQLLRATDLLLESGGFGLIALDLCDLPTPTARRIPLTTWFRFRRAVEHTPTVLIVFERQSIAGSCSSLLIKLGAAGKRNKKQPVNCETKPSHANLLTELEITAEIVRSRIERKPAASVTTFASKTAWAG
jgi:recA bacterial DNA recombination protein